MEKKRVYNINDFCKEKKLIYDLYAVSNHFGGLGGGHYTAFAKNHVNLSIVIFS